MTEGRYTSAFSEMGVRVHRRLMAMTDVVCATGGELHTSVLSSTEAIEREVEFDKWLAVNFDNGAPRTVPTWGELAYFVAGVAPGLVIVRVRSFRSTLKTTALPCAGLLWGDS